MVSCGCRGGEVTGAAGPKTTEMSRMALQLVFVMTASAERGGGIAAVNRMTIPALVEFAAERDIRLAILSMQGSDRDRPADLPEPHLFRAFEDRRHRFALAQLASWRCSRPLFLFERVGLAIPLMPLAVAGVARTVIFAHGRENWKSVRWVDQQSIRNSTFVITNSHFTLRKMQQRFRRLRAEACPLGLSVSHAMRSDAPEGPRARLQFKACDGRVRDLGSRMLLLVGRLDPQDRRKGHDALIKVLPRLLVRYPEVQLVFAGPDGDRAHVTQLAQREGVGSAVFVPGYVETSTLQRLYERCYAFVMPSKQEGFGLVYLEAMNFAKACVGCLDDGAEDVIVDRQTGYLVRDPHDAAELLTVVSKLLDDPARTQTLGRNGFDRLHDQFSPEHFRRQFIRLLAQTYDRAPDASTAASVASTRRH